MPNTLHSRSGPVLPCSGKQTSRGQMPALRSALKRPLILRNTIETGVAWSIQSNTRFLRVMRSEQTATWKLFNENVSRIDRQGFYEHEGIDKTEKAKAKFGFLFFCFYPLFAHTARHFKATLHRCGRWQNNIQTANRSKKKVNLMELHSSRILALENSWYQVFTSRECNLQKIFTLSERDSVAQFLFVGQSWLACSPVQKIHLPTNKSFSVSPSSGAYHHYYKSCR